MSNLALLDWFAVLLIKACVCYFLSNYFFHKMIAPPGLIQKEKVHIICEKGAQSSILANKIVTQWWPNFIIKDSNQTIHWFFFIFSLLCLHYIADLIKKLEWHLMIVSVLLEIKFEHAQVNAQNRFTYVKNSLYQPLPSKTMKNVFISSKKLFLFLRYSNFCKFFPFQIFQIQKDNWKWIILWCHELASINLQM